MTSKRSVQNSDFTSIMTPHETKKRRSATETTEGSCNLKLPHRFSCTSLPSLVSSPLTDFSEALLKGEMSTTGELDLNVSPATFVKTILLQSNSYVEKLCGNHNIFFIASENVEKESYFVKYTEEQQSAYNNEKICAVHNDNLPLLRSLYQSGQTMQTSNRFGESLLHIACRRGLTHIVEFFIQEADVCPRIHDDMGRTPMHDTCWSSSSPNHALMRLLIACAPEMLLSKDVRGHTPFDYARREHWPNWIIFLNDNRQFILNSFISSCFDGEKVTRSAQAEIANILEKSIQIVG